MKKPSVFVTHRIPEAGLRILHELCQVRVWEEMLLPREVLLREASTADGLLSLLFDQIDAELMDACPHLRVVSNMAVGFDNIAVDEASKRGILVGNTPGILTDATADLAFALLMAVARRIVEAADYVRAGKWRTWEPNLLMGQDIHGATLGIIGLGRIGAAMAKRARGFGMRVLYFSATRHEELETELGLHYVGLDMLLANADFVSIHTPLTPATYHLMDSERFEQMKPDAMLINTSRGQVVDTEALLVALQTGEIAGAALDVTDPEPLPADHPLMALPNCLIVPHIASATTATREHMSVVAARNILAGLRGEALPDGLNNEVVGKGRNALPRDW